MTRCAIAASVTVVLFSAGCVTSTAHRLVLIDNPLREQAVACEARCRQTATAKQDCMPFGGEACRDKVDPDRYGACLDSCPGSRATDGASCPSPDPGAVCVETTKANVGGIIGWTVALAAVGLLIGFLVLLDGILSGPIIIL